MTACVALCAGHTCPQPPTDLSLFPCVITPCTTQQPHPSQGLSRTPIQLLRLPQLCWYLLRLQLVDTPRQRRRLWSEQQQLLGYVLPLHTLVLLLALVFCVASPLIAPVTLLYFVSASVTQRYLWIYIYTHPYEGAGTLWRQVFSQVGGSDRNRPKLPPSLHACSQAVITHAAAKAFGEAS